MSALDDLKTRAEATDYAETSRHADVIAFCDTLAAESKKVQRGSLGKSGEGQDLVTLVVSNKKCFSPEDATAQGKVVVESSQPAEKIAAAIAAEGYQVQ